MVRAEPAVAAPMMHPPAPARHTCSAAQLVAIVALALVLTAFLVALLPAAAYQSSLTGTPCAGGSVPCWREHSGTGAADSLPPPPPPPPPAPAAPRPLELIIISDWHTHPDYSPSVRPGYPCFCSNASLDKSTTDNVPCARAQPASSYGQVGCDSPELLTSASLEAAAADIPQPDLVIVLGDLVWHESTGQASTQDIFHHVSRVIAQAFPGRPRACTVPLGNNDVYPGYHANNSNPREYTWQVTLTLVRVRVRLGLGLGLGLAPNPNPNPNAWQATVAREHCGIDAQTAAHFAQYGYYSFRMAAHPVLILVLNTNIYHPHNCPDGVLVRVRGRARVS